MDTGRKILTSIAIGLMFMAFLDFKLPIYISVGMTVFVTILTFHDYMHFGDSYIDAIYTSNRKWLALTINSLFKVLNVLNGLLKVLSEIVLFFSIPLSIFISYIAFDNISVENLNDLQQRLTLYTLGLVIITTTFSNKNLVN